ncbi:MAG TPA: sialidase family protein [Candidatus Thermoplasmatota archaeon]|nr:sialidase family protein [Candidatus Thermoplasmatota archaeon]
MRPLVLLAALLLPLAGCFSAPGGTLSTSDVPTDPGRLPFASHHGLITDGDGSGEPSMGVSPGGVLFTDVGSDVHVSRDNGTTWKNTGDHQPGIPNLDPDLAVGIDGTVWESRDYVGCVGVAVSRDLGATWTANPLVCPGTALDRQYVVPTREGTAYLYAHQIGSQQQLASKTTDYGATWLPLPPPEGVGHAYFANGGSGWGGGGFWDPVHDSVYFTYNYVEGKPSIFVDSTAHPAFSVSHDGGQSWRLGFAGDLTGQQLGLGLVTGAVDDAGNVYLTWGEASGSSNEKVAIYVAASRDDGATWTPKVRVDAGTGSKVFPIMAAGQPGRAAVAYYEGSKEAFPDAMDGVWNVTLAWTEDFFAANASWQHGTLEAGVKKGPICISGTVCQGDREFADYFDVVRMPDGRVAATYNVLKPGSSSVRNGFAITSEPLLGPRDRTLAG